MRCKNCGWENPGNKAKCEKCNALLTGSAGDPDDSFTGKSKPQKTSRGCPECGYPVREADQSCPRCGYSFSDTKQATPAVEEPKPEEAPEATSAKTPETKPVEAPEPTPAKITDATLNPWVRTEQIQSPKCSLTFISGTDESANDSPLRFSGNIILLHRGNTEPDNQTITSKTQAELCFENDKWYIQDKSALKTTYVYAGERKELKPGDIVVLGNRSFVFNCVSANQPG